MPNPSESTTEKLLRPIQVRKLLGVCAATLWNYGKAELLKPAQYTAGGHARYRETDVIAFMARLANSAVRTAA
jgi:DNA-binding transcriptional MerR regulator